MTDDKPKENASDTSLEKATSNKKTVTRPLTKEIGQSHIVTGNRLIQDMRKEELRPEVRHCTYHNMLYDDSVFAPIDFTNIQVVAGLAGGSVQPKKSAKSKKAAQFLNYCIRNMGYGTWMEALNTASTDLIHGFSPMNLVVKKAQYGKYKGAYTLHKLAPRRPESIYGWVYDKNNRELKGAVQKPMVTSLKEPLKRDFDRGFYYSSISGGYHTDSKYPFLQMDQMVLFRHNPTYDNPQGDSPLNHCYDAWVEISLIKHYEVVGKLN